jgi:hypothetical protein
MRHAIHHRAIRLVLIASSVLVACGDHDAARSSPAPTEHARAEEAREEPARPPSAPPGASAPTPQALAEAARIVREARALEHAGDHRAALERFDDALRLVPLQPRVLCEAGFVAYRAGDPGLAADRIDTALRVFGPPRRVSDRLRVPLAMCLYNRGLVAEALGDRGDAIGRFESSIALRPNATVSAALERARRALAAAPDSATLAPSVAGAASAAHVGGVVVTGAGDVLAPDAASLERVLRAGLRGYDELEERYLDASETTSTLAHALHDAGHPEVLVYDVTQHGEPLSRRLVVIAIRAADGYRVFQHTLGMDGITPSWDDPDMTVDALTITPSWSGEVLRVDVDVTVREDSLLWSTGEHDEPCQDGSEGTTRTTTALVCRVAGSTQCFELDTRHESTGVRTWSTCDGTPVDEQDRSSEDDVLASAVLEVGSEGIRLSELHDELGMLNEGLESERSWAELESEGVVMSTPEWSTDEVAGASAR